VVQNKPPTPRQPENRKHSKNPSFFIVGIIALLHPTSQGHYTLGDGDTFETQSGSSRAERAGEGLIDQGADGLFSPSGAGNGPKSAETTLMTGFPSASMLAESTIRTLASRLPCLAFP